MHLPLLQLELRLELALLELIQLVLYEEHVVRELDEQRVQLLQPVHAQCDYLMLRLCKSKL
jgi:hypothetical protein